MIKTSLATSGELRIKYPGISRNGLSTALLNNFHIIPAYHPALETYKTLWISGDKFKNLNNDGIIKENGKEFQIIYQNCNPYEVKKAKEIRLSFRAAKDIFNLSPIVIVRIAKH